MARAPTDTNGIDLESDAPTGGDSALVGDPSGDGHIVVDGDEENDDWDSNRPVNRPSVLPSARRMTMTTLAMTRKTPV